MCADYQRDKGPQACAQAVQWQGLAQLGDLRYRIGERRSG